MDGVTIADSVNAWRVLETSHPPVYYIPLDDVVSEVLRPGEGSSFCEWKGQAVYYDAKLEGMTVPRIAWAYPSPSRAFAAIRDHLAFYLPALSAGYVDDELARPQPGGFYGGWITSDLAGPFKGGPGSHGW